MLFLSEYYCEICGRPVSKPKYYEVEGAILILCDECAKYGTPIKRTNIIRKRVMPSKRVEKKRQETPEWMLIDNYGEIIRKAREARRMSQEDLARLIKEPVSYIRKIESQKVIPSDNVIIKLEKALNISLRKPFDLSDVAEYHGFGIKKRISGKAQLTLGDVIIIKKPKRVKEEV